MGYQTSFTGKFNISPALKLEHFNYLVKFNETRRMKRNATLTAMREDPLREAVGLPVGIDGEYFVGGGGYSGQERTNGIESYNSPPRTQPGLWCPWTPTQNNVLEWDGGEKPYDYIEWLGYLITHFFIPWGYSLNGEVIWNGEEQGDIGRIVVKNNEIKVQYAELVWRDPYEN